MDASDDDQLTTNAWAEANGVAVGNQSSVTVSLRVCVRVCVCVCVFVIER